MKLWLRIARSFGRAGRDRRGGVAALVAIALPACLYMMALTIDVGGWAATREHEQTIADLAALAGATTYAEGASATNAAAMAADVAELNGLPVGTRSGTTTLTDNSANWTTSFGVNQNTEVVSASVQTAATSFFNGLFHSASTQTIPATASAQVVPPPAPNNQTLCVLALDGVATMTTTDTDVIMSGTASASSSSCGIESDGAISMSGSVYIDVPTLIVSGKITSSGGAQVECPSGYPSCEHLNAAQKSDPLAAQYASSLNVPSGGITYNGSTTLSAGTYSRSITFSGSGTYTFNPGVYYVNGSISASGSVTLTGSGVTLISTGGFSLSGTTTATLSAPTSGATKGLLFGTSSSGAIISLSGTSNTVLNGAVYAPNSALTLSGGSAQNANLCTTVVVSTINFSGTTQIGNSGCGATVPPIYVHPYVAKLVQ